MARTNTTVSVEAGLAADLRLWCDEHGVSRNAVIEEALAEWAGAPFVCQMRGGPRVEVPVRVERALLNQVDREGKRRLTGRRAVLDTMLAAELHPAPPAVPELRRRATARGPVAGP